MENSQISLGKTITLNNNSPMPLMGLGTWQLENVEECVKNSIKIGYRLIDTAKFYFNEEEIGRALQDCFKEGIVKREEMFITTKVWQDDHSDPVGALKASLERLQLDYVDLFLFHWPFGVLENGKMVKKVPAYKVWASMEECVRLGLTKAIGVSNFNVQLLLDLLSYAEIKPAVNQVELHPLFQQKDLVDFCRMNGIEITAYNPLLRGQCIQRDQNLFDQYDLSKNKIILELAKKHNKTPSQIVLNWHLHRKIAIIPKSSNFDRQLENLQSLDFTMSDEDYERIDNMDLNMRFNTTKWKPFAGGVEIFA